MTYKRAQKMTDTRLERLRVMLDKTQELAYQLIKDKILIDNPDIRHGENIISLLHWCTGEISMQIDGKPEENETIRYILFSLGCSTQMEDEEVWEIRGHISIGQSEVLEKYYTEQEATKAINSYFKYGAPVIKSIRPGDISKLVQMLE